MRLVDSHVHLFREYFSDDERQTVLAQARADGLVALVNCATRREDSAETVDLARAEPDVWAAVGIHPHEAKQLAADEVAVVAELRRLAAQPRVVAIGECGLDYHYDYSPRPAQQAALRAQVRLARDLGIPLVLHNRESDDDLLSILADERAGDVGGVVHAFSTTIEVAACCLDLGFHLGFGGIVTFKRADGVRAALRATPLDRILLETDSPYLTPAPHRGERNQPSRVRLVAERVAIELGLDVAEVAARTTDNARRLFRLPIPEV